MHGLRSRLLMAVATSVLCGSVCAQLADLDLMAPTPAAPVDPGQGMDSPYNCNCNYVRYSILRSTDKEIPPPLEAWKCIQCIDDWDHRTAHHSSD